MPTSTRNTYSVEPFETHTDRNSSFLRLHHYLIDSAAWQDLTPNAQSLYLRMKHKYRAKYGKKYKPLLQSNSLDISIVKREYSAWKSNAGGYWSSRTFANTIDELIAHGFVILCRSQYAERKCNIYGFSDSWKWYGTDKFHVKPEHYRSLKP
jgi:hypothetical protein